MCFSDRYNNVKKQKRTEDWLQFCQNNEEIGLEETFIINFVIIFFTTYSVWPNFRILKMIISGKIWILYTYDEPNDSKDLKNNTCTCAYCNFNYFKFAVQNSQIARQKIILLCKFFFCIALLLCKIFEWNHSLYCHLHYIHVREQEYKWCDEPYM